MAIEVGQCDDGGGGGGGGNPSTSADDECLVDDNGVFFRRTSDDGAGGVTISFVDVAGAAYVPVGTIQPCAGTQADIVFPDPQNVNVVNDPLNVNVENGFLTRESDPLVFCDDNGPFLKHVTYDSQGNILGTSTTDLLGVDYNTVGVERVCDADTPLVVLGEVCYIIPPDLVTTRRGVVVSDGAGGPITLLDLETGDPVVNFNYVACPSGDEALVTRDEEILVLCDDNGPFLRRFLYDGQTGAQIGAPLDVLLADGTTAYVTVGTVKVCGDAAPTPPPTADEIADAIAAEPNLPPWPPVSLSGHHKLLNAGEVWDSNVDPSPGSTLVGITYTILTGTADVNDRDGTPANGLPAGLSASWNSEDRDAMFGPQSITAQGGQTYVHWTERP